MKFIDTTSPVALDKCKKYDLQTVKKLLEGQFSHLIANGDFFKNKKVVIKPNLLMKASPDDAITSHPIVVEALIEVLKSYSPLSITLAESPGGPYSQTTLKIIYNSTGMSKVAESTGININYDTSFENVSYPDGKVCKNFDIITPILNADIIVDICKLKTHSLTTMSGAVKNLFGTIPGIHKFEMHTRFKDLSVFEPMLVDLCAFHCSRVPVLSICDAVYGMEGNGPSGGDVRNYGLLLSSLNPFNLDSVCSEILGIENTVGFIEEGKKRGFCPLSTKEITVIGTQTDDCKINNVKLPDTKSLWFLRNLPTMFGGRLNKFFEPKPVINTNKCIGCGECVRSCPASTITLIKTNKKNSKKIARINHEKCIKCYCCQELCPIQAVKIKNNPIFKILK